MVSCGALAVERVATPVPFMVEAQSLPMALNDWAQQAGLQVVWQPDDSARQMVAPRVAGTLDAEAALKLLLQGSGFTYTFVDAQTVAIRYETTLSTKGVVWISESSGSTTQRSSAEPSVQLQLARETQLETLAEEIVVTGTHIRGTRPVGSPITIIERQKIEASGLSSVADVVRTLPQNYGGGGNELTSGGPTTLNGASSNIGRGTGLNLRGLGTESTLTLINGRRIASNGEGTLVDVSIVPLAAVERIEVLTDGASAVYGSDAVGGVVNVILRNDYVGAETSARVGSVTDGGQKEYQLSQVLGRAWGSGQVLAAYQFDKADPLFAEDRSFTSDSDLRRYGGSNRGVPDSNPGTIVAGGRTFAIPTGQDGTNLSPSDLIAGTSNISNLLEGTTMLSDRRAHSAYAYVSQDMAGPVRAFFEGRYMRRDYVDLRRQESLSLSVPSSNPFYVDPVGGLPRISVRYAFGDDLGPRRTEGTVDAYSGTAGVDIDIRRAWRAQVYTTFSREEVDRHEITLNRFFLPQVLADTNPQTAFNPFGDGSNTSPATLQLLKGFRSTKADSELRSVNGTLTGELLSIPGGLIKVAIGAEYREETRVGTLTALTNSVAPIFQRGDASHPDVGREVSSYFGEVNVPLVSATNRMPGLEQLGVTAALRYSDYSDFGSTTTPKFGLTWSPLAGMSVRGTYGRSFRAPNLQLSDTRNNFNVIAFVPDPTSPTGTSASLLMLGNNADSILPERATTWTAGLDLAPNSFPGLSVGLTYFDIEYGDRIASAIDRFGSVLAQDAVYSSIVVRNPSPEQINEIVNGPIPTSDTGTGVLPAGVAAIIDFRTTNISVSEVRGIDAALSYSINTEVGDFGAEVNVSYYFDFTDLFTVTAPAIETIGTVGKPVDTALRGGITWSRNSWTIDGFVNYLDGYKDNQSVPNRTVDSYTTVDFRTAYELGGGSQKSTLSGLTVSLFVRNLLDRDPPFFNNIAGIAFDPEKASPQGRFITVQATKRF